MVRRSLRGPVGAPDEDQVAEVEVFGVEGDGALTPLTRPELRHWSTMEVCSAIRSVAEVRAQPGHRPGGYADRVTIVGPVSSSSLVRRGGREDVVAPVHVAPATASRLLHSGELFVTPVPGLAVDQPSLAIEGLGSTWRVTVRYGRFGFRRRARLRAYPSPSANLTVLELVPTTKSPFRSSAFIRIGVPAIATLAKRIVVASSRRQDERLNQ